MIWFLYIALVIIIVLITLYIVNKKNAITQITSFDLPTFVDRNDFDDKEKEILVVVFTSQHCEGCETVLNKVNVL